jgi:hypothetical protein
MLAACSPDETETAQTREPVPAPVPVDPETAANANAEQLEETTWHIDNYIVDFEEGGKIRARGEAVPVPGGVAGSYTVENGVIEISAAGQTFTGTWDGANLIIEGQAGVRQESS